MKKTLIITIITIFLIGCNSDLEIRPVVETNIESLSTEYVKAVISGKVTDNGGSTINKKGFCYDKNPNVNFGDSIFTNVSDDSDGFSAIIEDLEPYTTYYIKAFATNEVGYGYGEEASFTTGDLNISPPCVPIVNSFEFNGNGHNVTNKTLNAQTYFLGHTNQNTKISIDFHEAPESGIYPTIKSGVDSSLSDKCSLSIISGNFYNGIHFYPEDDSLVYVKKTGENKYIVTFCDLEFSSTQTSIAFTSSGNLTYE